MISRGKILGIFILTGLFIGVSCLQGICGVVLKKQTYTVIPGKGSTPPTQVWIEYAQNNKVAVYQRDAVFITDIGTNTLINIVPSRKIYAINDIDAFIRKIRKIVAQIKAQQPPERKKSQGSPLKVTVKKTGKTKSFLGYPSKQVILYANNKKAKELWITDKIPLKKEIDIDKAFKKRFQIEDIFVDLSGTKDIEATDEYKNLFRGGWVSMMTITYNAGTEDIERVTQVQITKIAEKIFEVPKGFKKVSIEEFMRH